MITEIATVMCIKFTEPDKNITDFPTYIKKIYNSPYVKYDLNKSLDKIKIIID